MLGAAQADALGPEGAGPGGVDPGVGVGPHIEVPRPDLVGPRQDGAEGLGHRTHAQGHGTEHHVAGAAVEGDDVALVHGHVPDRERGAGDPDLLGAADRRLAPAPGHHGGVTDESAPGGEDALGHRHAVDVLRRGLVAHQHHLFTPLGRLGGVVGAEVGLAHRRSR